MNKEKKGNNNQQKINLFSEIEEDVLDFWDKSKIFEKSVKKKAPKGDYVFYDGPPFATGTPHYGHIAGSLIKDAIPRYWTMRGFRVERKWGWDCHGLPIENIVEKEMGSQSKKDIEKIGVDKFNEQCRSKVLKYVEEWKKTIRRLGRWADMENCYKTMDLNFMESVWWVFKQLYDKGLIYEGYRSMHICPRCETTLSQSEVAEGYRDIKDLSATVKFRIKNQESRTKNQELKIKDIKENVYIIVWTTTPWTLIGNVALAVGKNIKYVKVKQQSKNKKVFLISGKHSFASKGYYPKLKKKLEKKGYIVTIIDHLETNNPILSDNLEMFSAYDFTGAHIITHSLGASTILKFLNDTKVIISTLTMIAPGYPGKPSIHSDNQDWLKKSGYENFKIDFKKIKRQIKNIPVIIYSDNDNIVRVEKLLLLGKDLEAKIINEKNKGHFFEKESTNEPDFNIDFSEFYILAKDRLEEVLKDKKYEFIADVNSKDLVGLKYEPIFDYYLDKNEKLLKTAGDKKNTVELVVIDKKDKILLGLREYSKNFKGEKDRWIVPGGRSEIGENLEKTIQREIKEESNIQKYEIIKYLGSGKGYQQGDIVNWFLIKVDNLKQIKNNEPEKFAEWRFFDLKDIPIDMTFDGDFGYYQKAIRENNAYKIYAGDFVNTDEGTGVVHIAPAFGDDDMKLGEKENLPFIQHIGMDGVIKKEAKDFAGMNVKPLGDHQKTDIEIIKYLAHHNLLFAKKKYEHSYPHCWRCDSPLLNYATSSWFVNILKIKERMLELAKDINWSPEHIKKGRWGKWLEGARDWSISRQRFWASVIPIWKCEKCGELKVIGSVDELNEARGVSKIIVVRHGQAEHNLKNLMNGKIENNIYNLTLQGKKGAAELAKNLKNEKVDLIICSDLLRTKQTAEILNKNWNAKIIFEPRLRDIDAGIFEKQSVEKSLKFRRQSNNFYTAKHPEGESMADVEKRTSEALNEIKKQFQNKTILIVSHEDPIRTIYKYFDQGKKSENFFTSPKLKITTASHHIFYFQPITDLHKDTVDKITFKCKKCDGEMRRVPDVLDCWFESGSMPYAQCHYPFENKEKFEKNFPAEFIAEGADQTRCWFYYLHAIAGGIKDSAAFKNVIVNGMVLAKDGKKMSKKLQNYPKPDFLFEKYSADALRYYLLSSPVMLADTLCFAEQGVQEAMRKNIMLLWNVYKFYSIYENPKSEIRNPKSENILDKWILARLNQLIAEVTENMNNYNLPKATRPIENFISDFSTWYIRRSRDRFKGENEQDKKMALQTTRFVLLELSKIMAPFMPFIAEQVWQKITGNNFQDKNKSVHLENWIKSDVIDDEVLENMEIIRRIVELGLAERDKAKIKVRQPLNKLLIINYQSSNNENESLIKDELNIKKVEFKKGDGDLNVELDTEITPELKQEGIKREIVRLINAMRKNLGLTIQDKISVFWKSESDEIKSALKNYKNEIAKEVLADEITQGADGKIVKKPTKINDDDIVIGIAKNADKKILDNIQDISENEFKKIIGSGDAEIIDTREAKEYKIISFKNSKSVPLAEIRDRINEIDWNKNVIFSCKTGARSRMAAILIAEQTGNKIKNLKDGITGYYKKENKNDLEFNELGDYFA